MIIAEIGQAHDGSLGLLHSYIDALADSGVDAIKFQTHIADAESSSYEPFRVAFSYEDKSRYDYWKRMEFSPEQWAGIKQHCEKHNLEFISAPFSNAAVDLLESIGAKRYKIGSGEVANHLLLNKVASLKKPVLLSSGMSNWNELDEAVAIFKKQATDFSILQCITAYPSKPEQWGLNLIQELKDRYQVAIGYSDHSGDIYACLAAAAMGAELFEFHVVFHEKMFGPDTTSSIAMDKVKMLVKGIHQIQTALRNPVEKNEIKEVIAIKPAFEKSLVLNRDLPKDTVLAAHHLEAKKPSGYGIAPRDFGQVEGRKLITDKRQWDFLNYDDLA